MATTNTGRVPYIPIEGCLAPCVVSSAANIILSGEQTVDSVSVTAGDRVLVRSQTNTAENGIYIVRVGGWTRSSDYSRGSIISGLMVVDGTNNKLYELAFSGSYVAGTTTVTVTSQGDASNIGISTGDQTFTGDNQFQGGMQTEGSAAGYDIEIDFSDALYVKVPVFANTVAANAAITNSGTGVLLGYFTDSNKLVFNYASTTWKNVSDLSTAV